MLVAILMIVGLVFGGIITWNGVVNKNAGELLMGFSIFTGIIVVGLMYGK